MVKNHGVRHLAIIMDGNRRWAKRRGLPALAGHRRGYDVVLKMGDWCLDRGIEILTVYAFSAENWNRSKKEVDYLMKRAALILCLLFASAAGAALPEKPAGYVSDFAGLLEEPAKSALEGLLFRTEQETSAEISVVTVASLDGRDIEGYAAELFEKWKIGKKDKDNGVLLLVAPNERKVRIEVGYGLEGVLPDGLAGEIIREQMTPAFKRGDYAAGLLAGTERIVRIVRQEEPAGTAEEKNAPQTGAVQLGLVAFFGMFVFIGLFFAGAGLGSGAFLLVVWGLMFGGIPLSSDELPAHPSYRE
jgi:uncharacterized protein